MSIQLGGNTIDNDHPLPVATALSGALAPSDTATDIALDDSTEIVPARFATNPVPAAAENGWRVDAIGFGGRVRTFSQFVGSVTACTLRLYLRRPGGTNWYAGASTADLGGYTASGGVLINQAHDWDIGEGIEFRFAVEAISPGSAGNTVSVKAGGVRR